MSLFLRMVLESVLVSFFYKWLTSTECVLSLFTDKKKSPDALGSSLKFTKPRGEAAVTSTAANTALLSEPFWVPGTTGCHQPLNRLALNTPRLLGLWDTAGWATEAASVLSLVTIPCVCACPVVLELLPHPSTYLACRTYTKQVPSKSLLNGWMLKHY